ncbi:MAG TPA: ABC transporter permease [Candidatus Eisenbacteria bacterium]|nr:ABC transporter permease [Candidatus Eisenbacteria bacterium]
MSTSELTLTGGRVLPRRRTGPRLLRSELRLVLRRRRNIALLVVLACGPVLLGLAVRASAPNRGEGPPFLSQVTQNGLFLAFTSLVVALPLFLPLAVSVVGGEAVAGEASTGTLRNLLVVPVGRTRLLAVKYAGIVTYATVCVFVVALMGVVVGLALFPAGPVTLLSGSTITFGQALLRALLVALYVSAMLAGVGAIGLFISTLTEVPMGAMAATAVLTVLCEIADSIPQISWVHPYLFTHWWTTFGDLLRSPVPTDGLGRGLMTAGVYVVLFLSLAWARFTTRDVTS